MCQINSKPLPQSEYIGYRVYDATVPGILTSFYSDKMLDHSIGVTRIAANKNMPFHMFATESDLRMWLSYIQWFLDAIDHKLRIFEAKFEGDLQIGEWSDNIQINTVTGLYCTLLKDVTECFTTT